MFRAAGCLDIDPRSLHGSGVRVLDSGFRFRVEELGLRVGGGGGWGYQVGSKPLKYLRPGLLYREMLLKPSALTVSYYFSPRHRCRANVAHIRQSRPDYGLGLKVKVV